MRKVYMPRTVTSKGLPHKCLWVYEKIATEQCCNVAVLQRSSNRRLCRSRTGRILPAPGTNQITGFVDFRPLAHLEKNEISCCLHFSRSKFPDPEPREIEGKPFSNPPTDPLHPHSVQARTKAGGHDAMSMYPQARSQNERPDPAGASRTGGAPLRKFTGTSLPNGKVSD